MYIHGIVMMVPSSSTSVPCIYCDLGNWKFLLTFKAFSLQNFKEHSVLLENLTIAVNEIKITCFLRKIRIVCCIVAYQQTEM